MAMWNGNNVTFKRNGRRLENPKLLLIVLIVNLHLLLW